MKLEKTTSTESTESGGEAASLSSIRQGKRQLCRAATLLQLVMGGIEKQRRYEEEAATDNLLIIPRTNSSFLCP